ncbi:MULTISPECIES: hypothetical protein [unclassified Janthinobacterium]|uniref:hypothetical protein n=1 Tax=unclassified Janthinobacterium TaxID=2610881 RepID=UPI000C7109D9|nr:MULTISPECIES: hypothetical protein [unclassified Janthinobacterium]PKV43759.1 hypothetical protein CLU92_1080 [Janthinobacterium sp. 61]TDY36013.1 hypothetical protein C8C89_3889 [Janthinobacterium sp. 75]
MHIVNFVARAPTAAVGWSVYVPLYSALIASFVTILGIILNNYFSRVHKKEEQAHSIKKEIFLNFAEYISSSMALLQSVADPNSDLQGLLSKYKEQTGVIGKMYVVAEPSLLLEARALVTELEECGSEMVALRQGVDQIKLKVESLKGQRVDTSKALDNLTNHHLSLIRTGVMPPENVQLALQWERDFTTKRLDSLSDEIYKAEVEAYHSALSLFEFGILASQKVEASTLPTLRRIKSELGIPHDALNYEKVVEAQNKRRIEAARKQIGLQKTTNPDAQKND